MTLNNNPFQATGAVNNVDNIALNVARNAQQTIQEIQNNWTVGNYLLTLTDGHSGDGAYAGSSAFDTIKFANSVAAVNEEDVQIMIANSVMDTIAEMRNLVHMEMTGIGGREPSSMVTYAIEATRASEAFVMNQLFMYLSDMNVANNLRFQRDQKLRLYKQMSDAANTSFWFNLIPLVGGTVGNYYSNMMDMYAQKDQYEETNNADLDVDETLSDDVLNGLLNSSSDNYGIVNTGDGNLAVNYQNIADARAKEVQRFISESVEASIRKVLREMRSITHMEMTGIQGSVGSDLTDEVLLESFQTAMESISMLTQYLSQKAEIANRVNDANLQINKLNSQINTSWVGIVVSVVVAAIVAYVTHGSVSWYSVVELASSAFNTIMTVFKTVTSWIEHTFAQDRAKDDMGGISNYLKLKETMDNSVDSVKSKLETLQQQCLDEINADLIQDMGAGFIGVNKGLSYQYKELIEKLYRGEKTRADISQTLRELRNIVNEAMTGISGISINTTQTVLNFMEQDIKAKIDDMFNKLEVACARWNQITEAERTALADEMQAWMDTISAAIQVVEFVISLTEAIQNENSQEASNYKAKQAEVSKAEKALKGAKATDTKSLDEVKSDLQAALNKAKADFNTAKSAYYTMANARSNNLKPLTYTLDALQVLTPMLFAYIEKAAMQDVQKNREAEVAGKGITKDVKTSKVVAENGMAGDFASFGATEEAMSGQISLDNDAAVKVSQSNSEITKIFNENLLQFWKGLEKETEAIGISEFKEHMQNVKNNAAQPYIKALNTFKDRLDGVKVDGKPLSEKQKSAVMKIYKDSKTDQDLFSKKIGELKVDGKNLTQKATDQIMKAYKDAIAEAKPAKEAPAKTTSKPSAIPGQQPATQAAPQPATQAAPQPATQAAPQAATPAHQVQAAQSPVSPAQANKAETKLMNAIVKLENLKTKAAEKLALIKELIPAAKTTAHMKPETVKAAKKALRDALVQAKEIKHDVANISKEVNNVKEALKASKAAAGLAIQASSSVTPPSAGKTEQQQSANSSPVLQRLDALLKSVSEMIEQTNAALSAVTDLDAQLNLNTVAKSSAEKQKLDLPTLKDLLKQLQDNLADIGRKLAVEKANLVKITQTEIPALIKLSAAAKEEIETLIQKRNKEIEKDNKTIKDLKMLAANQPDKKGLIDKHLRQLNGKRNKEYQSLDELKIAESAIQYARKQNNEKIVAGKSRIQELQEEKQATQQDIKGIQVALGQLENKESNKEEAGKNINVSLDPMAFALSKNAVKV